MAILLRRVGVALADKLVPRRSPRALTAFPAPRPLPADSTSPSPIHLCGPLGASARPPRASLPPGSSPPTHVCHVRVPECVVHAPGAGATGPPTTFLHPPAASRPPYRATEIQPRLSAPNLTSATCPGQSPPSEAPTDGPMRASCRRQERAAAAQTPPRTRAVSSTAHRHRLFESPRWPTTQ
jgi:hypothetical protein